MTLSLGVNTIISLIRLYFYATQIMIVRRRVAVVSYINVFFSVLHKLLSNCHLVLHPIFEELKRSIG